MRVSYFNRQSRFRRKLPSTLHLCQNKERTKILKKAQKLLLIQQDNPFCCWVLGASALFSSSCVFCIQQIELSIGIQESLNGESGQQLKEPSIGVLSLPCLINLVQTWTNSLKRSMIRSMASLASNHFCAFKCWSSKDLQKHFHDTKLKMKKTKQMKRIVKKWTNPMIGPIATITSFSSLSRCSSQKWHWSAVREKSLLRRLSPICTCLPCYHKSIQPWWKSKRAYLDKAICSWSRTYRIWLAAFCMTQSLMLRRNSSLTATQIMCSTSLTLRILLRCFLRGATWPKDKNSCRLLDGCKLIEKTKTQCTHQLNGSIITANSTTKMCKERTLKRRTKESCSSLRACPQSSLSPCSKKAYCMTLVRATCHGTTDTCSLSYRHHLEGQHKKRITYFGFNGAWAS